jgi:predicted nucleic acid-binding protein
LQRKIKNHEAAQEVVTLITQAYFTKESIEPVSSENLEQAAKFFHQGYSGKTTLADSVVAAVAKKHNTEYIFSFDE